MISTITAFIQKYLMAGMGVIIALLLATSGFYYLRCGQLTNTVSSLTLSLTAATDANLVSQATISALKLERTKLSNICESRMQGYDETLAELIRIDGLKGGSNGQRDETFMGVGNGSGNGSGNMLLDSLNGLYPMPVGSEARVCEAGYTGNAESSGALPGSVLPSRGPLYCFCSEQDVKNFLKNSVLDRNYENQLVTILDGLR